MKKIIACVLFLFSTQTVAEEASRESALSSARLHGLEFIAPQERWAVRVELRQNSYDDFYGTDRNRRSLAAPFDQVELNSQLFPDLAAFGPTASLGNTRFSTDVETRRVELTVGYGVTDNLTLGFIIPYGEVKTRARLSVSGGNIGFNPAFDPALPVGTSNSPLLPVGLGPSEPVGTAGVQQILSDPAFGLAYRPITSTRWKGLGDPTLGLLWRFYKSARDSLILGTGVRIGLARDIDNDDLLQVPMDDGTTDYRLRMEYYRDLRSGLDLKLATEYTYQFADRVTRRVPVAGSLLAPANSKETLDRQLGDYWEYDIGIGKAFADWRVAATWHRYVKSADQYTSSVGTDTRALSANTDLFANQWRASVSWSGIHAWQDGHLPLPLIIQLEIQETYEARNFPDVRDIYLQLTSFF